MEMKPSFITRNVMTLDTPSKVAKTGRKRLPLWVFPRWLVWCFTVGIFAAIAWNSAGASTADDKKAVAALDTEYQAAVKKNDAATMGRILANDFVLVTGNGKAYTKIDLVNEARDGHTIYEHQEDTEQQVRVWGDTAVVTAKLWEKGTDNGKPFDHTLWFSDTYVRTPTGWRYVFGQASLPLTTAGSAKQ
jgi:ketosteroid isomerase-like protein